MAVFIEAHTLTDGGQSAQDVAARLGAFINAASASLRIAIYDFNLSDAVETPVVGAIRDAAARGVDVRLIYNVDHSRPIPVPPPPATDAQQIARCGIPTKAIVGVPHLMHQKYAVRDGTDTWTGSTNWTDDSWTREENVIVTVASRAIAAGYERDFDDLWKTELVLGSGEHDSEPATAGSSRAIALFSPGRGKHIAHRIADVMTSAKRRIRVCSPVITAGPILGSLTELATEQRVDLAGVFDATQMTEVLGQWRQDPRARWKIPTFRCLVENAPFGGKRSTPWGPGTTHDFMHAKVTVADDTVFVGSYNLSRSGMDNAENVLEINDGSLADQMATFIDDVRKRYPLSPLPLD